MKTKYCSKCKEFLPFRAFGYNRNAKDGRHYRCKVCASKTTAAWQAANVAWVKIINAGWYRKNRKRVIAYAGAWRKANPGKSSALSMAHKAAKLHATPPWVNLKEIEKIYVEAAQLGLTVDHRIPLQGRGVRGLHVPWNLQFLTKSENSSKGNRWEQPT